MNKLHKAIIDVIEAWDADARADTYWIDLDGKFEILRSLIEQPEQAQEYLDLNKDS